MSSLEFMRRLEELLSDISPSEREEALQYYSDYFHDAGAENEQSVIEALGTPEQVAEIVKQGLNESGGRGEFTEQGFTDGAEKSDKKEVVKRSVYEEAAEQEEESGKKGLPVWAVVLIAAACVLVSPAILGIVCSLLSVIIILVCAAVVLIVVIAVITIVLFAVTVSLVAGGVGLLFSSPLDGLGMIGGGCITAAVGILFMILTVLVIGKGIPGLCRGTAFIVRKITGREKGAQA